MKWAKRFFRELFCRHDMGLAADWTPGEICIHAMCPKCGKHFGHYHIPSFSDKPKNTRVRIH